MTGGAGFIGSHVAEYYADSDCKVTILDNLARGEILADASDSKKINLYNLRYLEEAYPDIEFVEGDVRDYETVAPLVEDVDGIVHTAGQVAVTTSITDPRIDFETNALGTFNVLEAAREAESDPTVAFASTNKVYGDNVNDLEVVEEKTRFRFENPSFQDGIPESFPIDGCKHTPYGTSKLAADLYVQDYAQRGVLDAATFRMSCIYGTRQFGNEDQGWIAHFLRSTLNSDELMIYGNGKQVRDILFVKDLVKAYDAFLSNPSGKPAVFNIGGAPENSVSLIEILTMLEEEFGLSPTYNFSDWREGDQRVYISDIERARTALDWKPTVSVREGLKQLINWFQQQF